MWNLFRKKIEKTKLADPFFIQKQLFAKSDNITIFDIHLPKIVSFSKHICV
jgi:hypothetical protein